ncbi:MAG: DsbC family protein [Thiothrix sp.]|uniref:DsbC family protein n=1 Tax=Thiothrix sp. TaxID=1032 RepID=UPI00262840E2|nr:DsbC family protein [Thiothrix sp.]MDD5394857.1 DsbC family protein [Thiothrix sp.]
MRLSGLVCAYLAAIVLVALAWGWAGEWQAGRHIRTALPSTTISSVQPSAIGGLYEIKASGNTLYADASGRYLVVGHIYDLKTAKDLTQSEGEAVASAATGAPDTRQGQATATAGQAEPQPEPEAATANLANRISWYSLPLEGAVHWGTPGKPKLAIWSDTHCPYCQQLHQVLQPLAAELDIYEILFPVHTEAKPEMAAVLCANRPKAALDAAFAGNPPAMDANANPCLGKLDAVVATALNLGIGGTPTLVAGDGRVQAGAGSAQQLRDWLLQPASPP